MDIEKVKTLRKIANTIPILYVEDNVGLRTQAADFLEKMFSKVYTAGDGEEGLASFKLNNPKIIITDITMPNMDGIEFSKALRELDSAVQIIFTTARDDSKYMLNAIDYKIFKYIIKPLALELLIDVLYDCVVQIKATENKDIFVKQINNIFNHQDNFVLLMESEKVVMANDKCIQFFSFKNIDEMINASFELSDHLLEHDQFLFSTQETNYFENIIKHPKRLFHTKISDNNNVSHHFMLRTTVIENIEDNSKKYILSLNDITELNLLDLFDKKSMNHERAINNQETIYNLFKMLKRNSAEIRINSFYRGIKITNTAVIVDIHEKSMRLKTSLKQQKAVNYERMMILSSSTFPHDIQCRSILNNNTHDQSIESCEFSFLINSPTHRENVCVEADEQARLTLFYEEHNFVTDIEIVDLSINSISITMTNIPSGFHVKSLAHIDLVLYTNKKPLIINTSAKVLKLEEKKKIFHIVLIYTLTDKKHTDLLNYLAIRQLELIKEFKEILTTKD